MSLTANDIRSFEFGTQMRGYDKEEVDNLLEQIANELETAKQENVKLSMEIDSLKSQLTNLKQHEETIKGAAIDARRNADLTVNNAKKEAAAILERAKKEAEKTISDKSNKIKEIEQQIKKIEQTRKTYLAKLRNLISSHLDIAEKEAESEIKEVMAEVSSKSSGDNITVTDSKDVTSDAMETIGGSPEDKTEVPEELIASITRDVKDSPSAEAAETTDAELAEALRQYKELKTAQQAGKHKAEEKPKPIPSLASPDKKWVETTSRAEEVPAEFIVKNTPSQQAPPPPAQPPEGADKPVEPNPTPKQEPQAEPGPAKNPPPPLPDVAKEFDEIASKVEEEMDKAEKNK